MICYSARRAEWLPWYGVGGRAELASRREPKYIASVSPTTRIYVFFPLRVNSGQHIEKLTFKITRWKNRPKAICFCTNWRLCYRVSLLTYPLASYWRCRFKQSGCGVEKNAKEFNGGRNGRFLDAAGEPVTFLTMAHRHTHDRCNLLICCGPSTISQWRFKAIRASGGMTSWHSASLYDKQI